MPTPLQVNDFLNQAESCPVIDTRAPLEFDKGHVAGAINIPLLDDQQRAIVGAIYQSDGQQSAVLKGLELTGPKMRAIVESSLQLVSTSGNRSVLVYCRRGGLRSQSVGWLLEQAGLNVFTLRDGYKNFRRHVLESFKCRINLVVIAGLTGAGKTRQIELLRQKGEQVIDLENLANHRGSVFGGIGLSDQPTVPQFENNLFADLQRFDKSLRVWIEDESRKIGETFVPNELYEQLVAAPAVFLDVDRDIRRKVISDEYGCLPTVETAAAISKLSKRLGGQNVKAAHEALKKGDPAACVDILLQYYDKSYLHGNSQVPRKIIHRLSIEHPLSEDTTNRLIEIADKLNI